MGLKTDHIVKILQLEGVGRKTAFKICDIAKDESIKTDGDLLNFLQILLRINVSQGSFLLTRIRYNKHFTREIGYSIYRKGQT